MPSQRTRGRTTPEEIVAKSAAMRRLLDAALRIAPTDATVIVTGESGTGKERVASFLHSRSRRARGPFLAVNCGALPETLLDSELFGHVRGAFTGASSDKQGLFEAAASGTLFLDEIGETSPAVQVKLLRTLQEHTVRKVGGTRDLPVNARIIAATNRNLEEMVAERSFRKDLFYRLHVVALELPPLRDRREDILPLARQFIGRVCSDNACGPCTFGAGVLDRFLAYPWPGNVRELENAIERAVLLAEGKPRIEVDDLPPELRAVAAAGPARAHSAMTLAEVERRHILATLEHLGGDRRVAARALGIGTNTLWRKLKGYGLVRARSGAEAGRTARSRRS